MTDTGTMTDDTMTTTNKHEQIRHILHHCRTKYEPITRTTFVWSISNFWDMCSIIDTLTSSRIEGHHFRLQMCIDREKNKLNFFIHSIESEIKILKYDMYIQSSLSLVTFTNWKPFISSTDLLYDIPLETIRLHESVYLIDDTLSVYFIFESYEYILHNSIYEHVLEKQPLTAITKDFIYDESNSFVTLTINGKNLNVKKSVLASADSTIFNNMLNEIKKNKKKIVVPGAISYDIFQYIITYLESGGLLTLTLDTTYIDTPIDRNNYTYRLQELFVAAHQLDIKNLKALCEKRLIEYTLKENAVQHLSFAIINKAIRLENYATRLIKLHIDDIINTKEFTEIIKNNPAILHKFLKQELFIKEFAWYSHISENNKNYLKQNDIDEKNIDEKDDNEEDNDKENDENDTDKKNTDEKDDDEEDDDENDTDEKVDDEQGDKE